MIATKYFNLSMDWLCEQIFVDLVAAFLENEID